jgi:hypothetical protein
MAVDPFAAEESSRLSELWSYDIVDTEPEPGFDEVVRLSADLCRAPIAAVSIVESDRL